MTNIDTEFLSTFIHEMLNALNGVQAIAQVLADSSPLDSEELADSAADLMAMAQRAHALIIKLRTITNPNRTLLSPRKTIKELTDQIIPKQGQLPNSLKVIADPSLSSEDLMPQALFEGFAEPLIYVLLHSEDDAYIGRQIINIHYQDQPQPLFGFDVSNVQNAHYLSNLETIDAQLVLRSRFGFELKALYYMTTLFNLKIVVNQRGQQNYIIQVVIPN